MTPLFEIIIAKLMLPEYTLGNRFQKVVTTLHSCGGLVMLGADGHSSLAVSRMRERSSQLFQKACQVIPGGVTANIKYFPPHPIVMKRGSGSRLFDVDGNAYIDYALCYGALMLGHGHPRVLAAVEQHIAAAGTFVFGAPCELETAMAEKLIAHYAGIERVRFTNSGMEATQFAIRLAMAHTGRRKLAKFEGHYHGGYDQVLFSVHPERERGGERRRPHAVAASKGIPDYVQRETLALPFNDLEATARLLQENANDVAAVILEPVEGGFIPAEPAFLRGLRTVTEQLGIVLIFDEVKTGFRVALGGAQQVYGVTPDLTALGKVLGGGFPIGAVGGKRELMAQCDPREGQDILTAGREDGVQLGVRDGSASDVLFHSGTYNGHPLILAAGLATIDLLEQPGQLEQLFAHTNQLRKGLEDVYARRDIPMQTCGMGSIFNIVLTERPVANCRDMWHADTALRRAIDEELLNVGVYCKPLNRYSLSLAHSSADIQYTVDAHERAIDRVLSVRTSRM